MIRLSAKDGFYRLDFKTDDLASRQESQLAFWGFRFLTDENTYVKPVSEADGELVLKVVKYLEKHGCSFELGPTIKHQVSKAYHDKAALLDAKEKAYRFKSKGIMPDETKCFVAFLKTDVPRALKPHQVKAALHLLAAGNGANFSVPGSGKTTVVLSVFEYLRSQGKVDALFVLGPPACFGPWRMEYTQVLGKDPSCDILAGGNLDERRSRYQVNVDSVNDMYLTSFQTLHRDWEYVRTLFQHQGIRFFFVIDEAHYIKQQDGAWANAALEVARHAQRRCILTGTPFPRSYGDAFNLFDSLWPTTPPISEKEKTKISVFCEQNQYSKASAILDHAVSPLFYRVRKKDLGLSTQRFHDPVVVRMKKYEQKIFNAILDKVRHLSQQDYFRDIDLIMRLRRGRLMRLRQCLSYTALLGTAVEEYNEDLLKDNLPLCDVIMHYGDLETPAKLDALVELVMTLSDKGEKIVIWSNFVLTLELIEKKIEELGMGVGLIYGKTPFENSNVKEEVSREGIIRQFVKADSGLDVLVANPAACAESISLHKTCSHAIYYDLSYNCAQYLQSLDRIHRVGGSEDKEAHYYFLQYENSLDEDILANVRGKAARMSQIIDQDYPVYSLDMFAEDEELEAYERLFNN